MMGSTSQQYCLRWNNHRANLLAVFDDLLRSESFTDVTLACEGGTSVKCHKMVLAACSTYFQSLFAEVPCQHPVVVLKDVKYGEMKAILEYMYRGEVNVAQDHLAALLKVAEALKVKGLVEENGPLGGRHPHDRRPPSDEVGPVHSPPGTTTPTAAPHSSVSPTSHPLGSGPGTFDRSGPYNLYGKSPVGERSGSGGGGGRVSLPLWAVPGLPLPHHPSSVPPPGHPHAAAVLGGCYDSASDMSPLKRKKLQSLLLSRDTPILRTVLGQGQGQADSSQQPMSLVCQPDSHERVNSNGSDIDTDRQIIKVEQSIEEARSPYTDISNMDDDTSEKGGKMVLSQSFPNDMRETGELPWLQNLNILDIELPPGNETSQQPSVSSNLSDELENNESGKKNETTSTSKRKHHHEEDNRDRGKKHSKKTKKNKHKKDKRNSPVIDISTPTAEEDFYEDRSACRGFLKVETISRPAVPQYIRIKGKVLGNVGSSFWKKRNKIKYRYYTFSSDKDEIKSGGESKLTMMEKEETEIRHKTEEFNVVLSKEPNNVDMWIQYVNYQEVVLHFEKTYHGVHGRGTTAERQLSILDRALSQNPGDKQLIRKRLAIAESSLPADVAGRQIEVLLTSQPASIELWRGFVRTTQCSMALCSAPGVLKLYMRATQQLHQSRRGAPAANTVTAESSILDLLLDCGLFLRQAGLWEHLWVLVQAYLTLNLITPSTQHFDLKQEISEDEVMAEEMKVIRSQLPLMIMWTRVERIREDVHWLPASGEEDCEDPQRQVTGEDIAELVHPITSADLNFRLVAICITLLKVPLLPYRHCWSMLVGVDGVPWAVDGPEWLLPVLQPLSPVWRPPSPDLLRSVLPLAGGPQYLQSTLGQPSFLHALSTTMRAVSEALPEPYATAVLVWWLRFERLLLAMDRTGLIKSPTGHRKIKSSIKDILKQERYRNSLSLYHEFALLELETGRRDAAERVLSSSAEAAFPGTPVAGVGDPVARAALVAVYRSLCEARLAAGDRPGAVAALVSLATRRGGNTDSLIAEAVSKFAHISAELPGDAPCGEADGSEFLLADTTADWLTCHAWLLSLTQSPWVGAAVLEKHLTDNSAPENPVTKEMCRAERLWESYICLLQWHCIHNNATFAVLHDALVRGLNLFPNNLHFLACLSGIQSISNTVSVTWCQLTNHFRDSEAQLAQVFLILDCIHKSNKVHKANEEAHSYLQMGGPVIPDPSEHNRCLAMLDRLLDSPIVKHCPLLWRLKLKMQPQEGTFYQAVDECPWVRDLYLDGTVCVPGKADKLQSMLMEKELRYHVLPDELDVIRSGFEALSAQISQAR